MNQKDLLKNTRILRWLSKNIYQKHNTMLHKEIYMLLNNNIEDQGMDSTISYKIFYKGDVHHNHHPGKGFAKLIPLLDKYEEEFGKLVNELTLLTKERKHIEAFIKRALLICKNDADIAAIMPRQFNLAELDELEPWLYTDTLTKEDIKQFKLANQRSYDVLKERLMNNYILFNTYL